MNEGKDSTEATGQNTNGAEDKEKVPGNRQLLHDTLIARSRSQRFEGPIIIGVCMLLGAFAFDYYILNVRFVAPLSPTRYEEVPGFCIVLASRIGGNIVLEGLSLLIGAVVGSLLGGLLAGVLAMRHKTERQKVKEEFKEEAEETKKVWEQEAEKTKKSWQESGLWNAGWGRGKKIGVIVFVIIIILLIYCRVRGFVFEF